MDSEYEQLRIETWKKELSELLSFDEFNLIRNGEPVSITLWNTLNEFYQSDKCSGFQRGLLSGAFTSEYLAVMGLYESAFKQGELINDISNKARTEFLKQKVMPSYQKEQERLKVMSKAGKVTGRATTEKNKRDRAEQQKFIDDYHARNPTHTYADMRRAAARKFRVAADTIKGNTTNPKTRKKKGEQPS
ncbi:hypothetical protein AB4262_10695 [Vibrio breoganii]